MSASSLMSENNGGKRLRGGFWGPLLAMAVVLAVVAAVYGIYVAPHWSRAYGQDIPFNRAMFGRDLEQPIPFSHRLHATDKDIDCQYCHTYAERSLNAGLPPVSTCLGCHDHIIVSHEEILKLKGYATRHEEIPWVRVYYKPDHVFFPHYRHLKKGVQCQECHGEIETVDRLRQVTFYMGLCITCHQERSASMDCAACHQ